MKPESWMQGAPNGRADHVMAASLPQQSVGVTVSDTVITSTARQDGNTKQQPAISVTQTAVVTPAVHPFFGPRVAGLHLITSFPDILRSGNWQVPVAFPFPGIGTGDSDTQ